MTHLQFSPGLCPVCGGNVISMLHVQQDGHRWFVQLRDVEDWIPRALSVREMEPPQKIVMHQHPEWRDTKLMHNNGGTPSAA